jgi:hypothetical protein
MKKPIIVKESNYPRINAEIEAVEKRCTVRTIDNAETIAKALAEIENELNRLNIKDISVYQIEE